MQYATCGLEAWPSGTQDTKKQHCPLTHMQVSVFLLGSRSDGLSIGIVVELNTPSRRPGMPASEFVRCRKSQQETGRDPYRATQ